mmetsp:Transcript_28679/g.39978  ORF Transcript_28679/g.39978 Transcript_28679/m.39978 type:complete len:685 (+) Transcript_28679:29-2083(+)|eukprot:CAMPEP_0184503422 /NCGR_PEP_ID=MMETSP0113_2-20130426/51883_1 /TAXON_ID=91329 /ORGANISM="Norrisiella sphaerica, Strain BC52" /LENGTH=684 /DNA_ID=CAMNT_0026892917 /DNA_START=18 /DNA_END=2072 /DNA_ORIENTATION=+
MGAIVSKVLFPLPKPPDYDCDHPNLYWIPCKDRRRLHIPCLIFTQRRARFLLIYVHGNACDLGSVYNEVRYVSDFLGVHLLAMELRGYGLSQGFPSEKSINEDLAELYSFLTSTLRFPAERIIFFGRSIGTGPTTRLVSRLNRKGIRPAGLILQSPYTSILNVSRHLAGVAADMVVAERWKNIEEIRHVKSPLLVIHGKLDTLIPYSMAQDLYTSCPSKKKVLVLPESSDHNTFNLYNDILRPVASFIRTHAQACAREVGLAKAMTRNRDVKRPPSYKPNETRREGGNGNGHGRDYGGDIDIKTFASFEVDPQALKLPKFLQDVPFYAWEMHPGHKAVMSRLKKANMSHNVTPIQRTPSAHTLSVVPPTSDASSSRGGGRGTSQRSGEKVSFRAASPSLVVSGLVSGSTSALPSRRGEDFDLTPPEQAMRALEEALQQVQRTLMEPEHSPKPINAQNSNLPLLPSISLKDKPLHDNAVSAEGSIKPVSSSQPDKDPSPIPSPGTSPSSNSKGKEDSTRDVKRAERKQRVLVDLEVLSLVKALEGVMLCGLDVKAKMLEPPTFWPVVVDAAKCCSRSIKDSEREFVTDVRFIASQELNHSDAHCMLGRAWIKHLLANDRLYNALKTLAGLTLQHHHQGQGGAEAQTLGAKWYGPEGVINASREAREKLMAIALTIDGIPMSLQLD